MKKTIITIMIVMLGLGCTDATWTDDFDVSRVYEVTVYGSHNCTHITPCEIESKFTFDCRDVAEDYWSYPQSYQPFNFAFEKCNETFPELIQAEIDEQEKYESGNWTDSIGTQNIKLSGLYINNFTGKITLYNTTCRFIPCGINTDCLECEEIKVIEQ